MSCGRAGPPAARAACARSRVPHSEPHGHTRLPRVRQGDARRGRLFVALAAIAWSTAGLFQRELTVNLGTQLAGRALFAMLGIGVYIVATERGRSLAAFRAIGRPGLAIAALMAVSSGSFIAALNYTSVANVLFLQGLAPVLAAVLGMAIRSEERRVGKEC